MPKRRPSNPNSHSSKKPLKSRSSSAYDHPLGQRILLKADNILLKGKKYTDSAYKKAKRTPSALKITSSKNPSNNKNLQPTKISFTSLLKNHQRTSQNWKRRVEIRNKTSPTIPSLYPKETLSNNSEYAPKTHFPPYKKGKQSLNDSFKDLDAHDSDEIERQVPIQIQTEHKVEPFGEEIGGCDSEEKENRIKIVVDDKKPIQELKPTLESLKGSGEEKEEKVEKEEIVDDISEKKDYREDMMKEVNDIIGELQSILEPKVPNTCEDVISELPEIISVSNDTPIKKSQVSDLKKDLWKTEFLEEIEDEDSLKENFYQDLQSAPDFGHEIESKIVDNGPNIFWEKLLSENNKWDSPKTIKEEKRVLIDMTNYQQ